MYKLNPKLTKAPATCYLPKADKVVCFSKKDESELRKVATQSDLKEIFESKTIAADGYALVVKSEDKQK